MTLSSRFLHLLLLFFFSLLPPLRLCSALSPDGLTLLAFKSAVSGDPSTTTLVGWDEADADPCRWPGVSCANVSGYPYPRVVALSVAEQNLSGYIPSELGSLVFLRRLNLHGNLLSGPVPPQLSNASSLHSLLLYANNLSGPLPTSLCNLPRLQNLDLSRNALSGPVPHDLRNCRQLQRLLLAGNRLSGELPAGIWPELGGLVQLDLSSNDLTGRLPPDLGDLKSLSGTLNLSHNHFSGEIPSSLGGLPAAVRIDLRGNDLSGEIPQAGAFSNQAPAAFLGNPKLCGFPLFNPCEEASPGGQISVGGRGKKKGLGVGVIVLIAAADAVGVAAIGLALVYAYWKVKGSSRGCSCTGKTRLGGGDGRVCCWKRGGGGGGGGLCGGSSTRSGGSEGEEEEEGEGSEGGREGELVGIEKGFSMELEELLRASAYVLGKGKWGIGIVYKVVVGEGLPVAVRRLGEGGARGRREFAAEAEAVGRVRHPNVVRLRAYYWAPDEKLLISDFVPNGSLAAALRGRPGQPSLTWSTRLRIAIGTARGLAHIHECSPRRYVHGDLKPSAILLAADFTPLISDFGLLRLAHLAGCLDPSAAGGGGGGGGGGGLMGVALPKPPPAPPLDRPNGYRAPEARSPGSRPTQKWDVYSFGAVLLELLTGKSPAPAPGMEPAELARWVREGFEEERPLTELLDPGLLGEVQARKEVVAAFHVALACTESDPESRPRMKTVSDNLERIGT